MESVRALDWLSSHITVLGSRLANDGKGNWEKGIRSLDALLASWSARSLSYHGRALIANTLGFSLFWYLCSFPCLPSDVLKTINSRIFTFVWQKKREWLARSSVVQRWSQGGLGLVDMQQKSSPCVSYGCVVFLSTNIYHGPFSFGDKYQSMGLQVDWNHVWSSLTLCVQSETLHGLLHIPFCPQQDPLCHCGQQETFHHLFVECVFTTQVASWYHSILQQCLPSSMPPKQILIDSVLSPMRIWQSPSVVALRVSDWDLVLAFFVLFRVFGPMFVLWLTRIIPRGLHRSFQCF